MVKVCIEKKLLPVADMLLDIFTMRMANAVLHDDMSAQTNGVDAAAVSKVPQNSDVFICSDKFAEKNAGTAGIVELARRMKAKKVIIIGHDDSDQFFVSQEMNGKLIRLTIPIAAEKMPISVNYSLQMAVTLSLDDGHVAVADPTSRQLMALANRVAVTDVTVFINGPTGTGKEVLAKFIHNQSGRIDAPFVAVNCAAIPENMLEAILFGHEKGAFTGASTANKGIFRAADGGTLLLDEISEMPLGLQAKLLRALQERKVTPLGSQREIDVDVRVVATTNRNMLGEVKEGRFREDLFYRLNVFPLASQHLHERKNDIVAISTILLKRHAVAPGSIPALADDAIDLLLNYGWPGNVRELENVLQRALVLCSDNIISAADIMVDGTAIEQLTSSRMMQAQQDSALPA